MPSANVNAEPTHGAASADVVESDDQATRDQMQGRKATGDAIEAGRLRAELRKVEQERDDLLEELGRKRETEDKQVEQNGDDTEVKRDGKQGDASASAFTSANQSSTGNPTGKLKK